MHRCQSSSCPDTTWWSGVISSTSIYNGCKTVLDTQNTQVKLDEPSESVLYRLEGGWIGDFYESLQNMEVSKKNDRIEPISMQRKIDYTRQTIVKHSMKWNHTD